MGKYFSNPYERFKWKMEQTRKFSTKNLRPTTIIAPPLIDANCTHIKFSSTNVDLGAYVIRAKLWLKMEYFVGQLFMLAGNVSSSKNVQHSTLGPHMPYHGFVIPGSVIQMRNDTMSVTFQIRATYHLEKFHQNTSSRAGTIINIRPLLIISATACETPSGKLARLLRFKNESATEIANKDFSPRDEAFFSIIVFNSNVFYPRNVTVYSPKSCSPIYSPITLYYTEDDMLNRKAYIFKTICERLGYRSHTTFKLAIFAINRNGNCLRRSSFWSSPKYNFGLGMK